MTIIQKKNISIYQIFFSKKQLPFLERGFIPYSNEHSSCSEQREYPIFKKAYEEGLHRQSKLMGMLSWKFNGKSAISGHKFLQFIIDHPGHDVYFINPFPEENGYKNVWEQAEKCHEGIMEMAQDIFYAVGYSIRISDICNFHLTNAYCNFWVGSESFWDKYMQFTLPVYDYIINRASETFRRKLFTRADKLTDSVYFPFIMERLFSTLLAIEPSINYLKYSYTREELIQKYGWKNASGTRGLMTLDRSRLLEARNQFLS